MQLDQTITVDESQPAGGAESDGQFIEASRDTLAASIVRQHLAESIDREFANLAQAFRLQGTSD